MAPSFYTQFYFIIYKVKLIKEMKDVSKVCMQACRHAGTQPLDAWC